MFLGDWHGTEMSPLYSTGLGNMASTWLGEIALRTCITPLPGPAWVLLSYVLHTLFPSAVLWLTSCSVLFSLSLSFSFPIHACIILIIALILLANNR